MYVVSFLSDVFPRAFRLHPLRFLRVHGLLALIIIAVGLGICALVGLWAGKVAQGKGREFGVFFALGFLLTICGIIPGLIVVIIAYAISPAPAPGQATAGATPGMPPPGYQTQAPPPQPAQPPAPPTPSPQGGYEYVPPPAAASATGYTTARTSSSARTGERRPGATSASATSLAGAVTARATAGVRDIS